MELNAEQIIKALECCVKVGGYRDAQICNDCPLSETRCAILLPKNALSLITSQEQRIEALTVELAAMRGAANSYKIHNEKLTEENERLKLADSIASVSVPEALRIINEYCESYIKKAKAYTVEKMRSEIKRRCTEGGIYPAFVARVVDEVAKEMLEEK